MLSLLCACSAARPEISAAAPPLTLAVIGDLEGVLEPCGCTRRPLGGVDRLARALSDLRNARAPVLVVAAGNLFFEPSPAAEGDPERRAQAGIKADALIAVLTRLRPDVIAPGPADVVRGQDALRAVARSARTSLLGSATPVEGLASLTSSVLKSVGPYRVGLVAEDAQRRDRVVALRRRGADVVVMLRRAASRRPPAVSPEMGGADVIVVSGTEHAGAALERGAILVEAGKHAEELTVVRLRPGTSVSRRTWRLFAEPLPTHAAHVAQVRRQPLDANVQPDPAIRTLLDQLFARVNARHVDARGEDAERTSAAATYVGARTCAACHAGAYLWWARTRHASAYQTLLARGRALDLDCIGCHVTGFEAPGGATLGRLAELKGVGCESCHGPGGPHADNPQVYRTFVRRAVAESTCLGCHDPAHSDEFVYAKARAALIVPEHGARAAPSER